MKRKFFDIKSNKKNQPSLLEKAAVSSAILYSRGKRMETFFTEDSKLYITPKEVRLMQKGIELDRGIGKWDALSSRVKKSKIVNDFEKYSPSQVSILKDALEKRLQLLNDSFSDTSRSFLDQLTVVKLWNVSIVASILFGMVTMTFIYRYLGQNASAQIRANAVAQQEVAAAKIVQAENVSKAAKDDAAIETAKVLQNSKNQEESVLAKEIMEIVKGYPIEDMVPYIAKQNRTVAAFMIAIALQESSWGKHVPVLNGEVCYNDWGFRLKTNRMGSGGHTCFDSPKEAVDIVAKRIKYLVEEADIDTPKEMVYIWKCGGPDCSATGGQAAADNWANNVGDIFGKLKKTEKSFK